MGKKTISTVREVVALLGGPTETCRRIGAGSPQQVSNWLKAGAFPNRADLMLKISGEVLKVDADAVVAPALFGINGDRVDATLQKIVNP